MGAFLEALERAYQAIGGVFTQVHTVLDWKLWFGAHEKRYGTRYNARACMRKWQGLGTRKKTAKAHKAKALSKEGAGKADSKENENEGLLLLEKESVRAFWVCALVSASLLTNCVCPLSGVSAQLPP